MKFSKVILILVLFFTSSSFLYAFQGTSDTSNYTLNFNLGHSIVFYDNVTNSTHNSEQLITIKPYSTNYFTRAGNVFFDFAMSSYYSIPQFSILNLQDEANYNLTKLAINITGEFFKDIKTLNYSIDDIYFDLTDSVTGRVLDGQLDLKNYGNNNITFYFTDIYNIAGTYSLTINAILNLDSIINDTDADGINDSNDTIYGTTANINTDIFNLTLEVNSSTNISKIFTGVHNTTFKSNGSTIIEFNNNYSTNSINLSKVIIKQQTQVNQSKLLINGLTLQTNNTKIVYLNFTGNTTKYGSLCIKDEEIFSFTQISSDCNSSNEYYIKSIPYSDANYTITYVNISLNNLVKIQGLSHSGIEQVCTEDWSYTDWYCASGFLQRTASDANSCGTQASREEIIGAACSTPGGSSPSKKDDDPFVIYEPTKKENKTTTKTTTTNTPTTIEIPSTNDINANTQDNSLADNSDNTTQDLDSNSNQQNTNNDSFEISDYTNYIFAAIGFILLIGLILFIKNNLPQKHEQAPPPVQLSTFDRDYKVVKEYVQKYKAHYQSDEIYRELQKAGYSHEVINKVFDDEFN